MIGKIEKEKDLQWRIQDIEDIGGRGARGRGTNFSFGQVFPENWMEMKEIGTRGGRSSSAPPWFRKWCHIISFQSI